MAHDAIPDPSDPDAVGRAEFDTRRRGFDQNQVRAYLTVVSRELRRLRTRESELTAELEAATAAPPEVEFDEERATVLLGEETARVLGAARHAAAEKLERAGSDARGILADAEAEAARIRAAAHASADEHLANARLEARGLIAEAKLVRERLLEEFAQRRHVLRGQLEQMKAGRDRLSKSYDEIRRSLDEVAGQLDHALPNAQSAARRAAERNDIEPVPSASSVEREIAEARRAGVPIVTDDEVAASVASEDVIAANGGAPGDGDASADSNPDAADADAPDARTDPVGASPDSPEDAEPLADWVNSGVDADTGDPTDLFEAWSPDDEAFFLESDDVADDGKGAGSLSVDPGDDVESVSVVRGTPLPAPDDADHSESATTRGADGPAPTPEPDGTGTVEEAPSGQVSHVIPNVMIIDGLRRAAVVQAENEPHEIMLSELHRRGRATGLPREPVPILDRLDAAETVRVVLAPEAQPSAETPAPYDVDRDQPDEVRVTTEPAGEAGTETEDPAEAADPDAASLGTAGTEMTEPPIDLPIDEPRAAPRVAEFSPVPEPADSGQTDEAVSASAGTEPAEGRPAGKVDDLFARIRRNREAKVAAAEQVLRDSMADSSTEGPSGEGEAVGEAEPVPAATDTETDTDDVTAEAPPTISEDRLGAASLDDAAIFASRDAVLEPIQSQIVRKAKRLLADEQNDLLDFIRRSDGKIAEGDLLPPLEDHVGRYVAAVGGDLLTAVGAGGAFFEPTGSTARADLSGLDSRLADELVKPLRAQLERALHQADGDVDDLLDRVRSSYREIRNRRLVDAAHTVSSAAFNAGVEAASPNSMVRWAVDPVAGCSPDCDDNALEGPVEVGTTFPTGVTCPPGHGGCRCLLVPVPK